MRTYLLGAALAFALAAPAAAHAQTGHVDAAYSEQTYDFGGADFDAELTSLSGQVAFGGDGGIGVQVDGRYTHWAGDADDVDAFSLGAHVFTRRGAWLFGGYVGYDDVEDFNIEAWTGALETQYYFSRSTLTGTLSHSEWDGPDYTITMLEGEYRYFLTDNLSLHGGLGFGQGDIGGNDPDVWSAEAGGEYQFAALPVSVFGFYRRGEIDFNVGSIETDALGVGVRYNFGGTLMDRNRRGAGLNRVLPLFERFIS
jgi:hypothetical protein